MLGEQQQALAFVRPVERLDLGEIAPEPARRSSMNSARVPADSTRGDERRPSVLPSRVRIVSAAAAVITRVSRASG